MIAMNNPISDTIPRRRSKRRLIAAIAILVAAWTLAIFYRMEIRAHWWVYRIQHVESAEQRQYYFSCLASIGDTALTALPRLLDDPRADVRLLGVRLLRWCPSKKTQALLITHLTDQSDEVSQQAALEIARREDRSEAIPALKKLVQSAEPHSARMAVATIERIGGSEAEAILLEILYKTQDVDLLAQVIDSLGMLSSHQAVPTLEKMLDDKRPITIQPASQRRVQKVIAKIQGQLTTKGINPQAVLEASHSEQTIASVAARAISLIKGKTYTSSNPLPQE